MNALKNIRPSSKLKKEIARYAISFFFAWLASALFSDFPYFKHLFIESLSLDSLLTSLSVNSTEVLINLVGFNTYSQGNYLQIIGTPGVIFAYGCLGFREFAFFVVFILFQNGGIKNKLWYIPSGLVLLFALNIIRAVIIAITQYYNPENTILVHDVVSPILMYPAILFLWIFWLSKFAKATTTLSDTTKTTEKGKI